jgi:CubicO group peptidase (beta-lactamase class C family)
VARKSYDAVVTETLIKPLGLTRTSVFKPQNDSVGVISYNANDWEWDLGIENA